jgi:hypothetical protein
VGVLLEAGTAYPSRAPVFTPGFWWGPCCSSFLVYCVMFFVLFVFVSSLVHPLLPVSMVCSFLIALRFSLTFIL